MVLFHLGFIRISFKQSSVLVFGFGSRFWNTFDFGLMQIGLCIVLYTCIAMLFYVMVWATSFYLFLSFSLSYILSLNNSRRRDNWGEQQSTLNELRI
jgi:hypothetical protein